MDRLIELIYAEDPRVAIVACKAILDRALGKPRQQTEEPEERQPLDLSVLSPEEREQLAKLLAKVRAADEG